MNRRARTKVDDGDKGVALYHIVYPHERFDEAARTLFTLVRDAQQRFPNKRRALYLDIEGHRNEHGGFDTDMSELQKEFLMEFVGRFLAEIHCPLINVTRTGQENDIPDRLEIQSRGERGPTANA